MIRMIFAMTLYMVVLAARCAPLAAGSYQYWSNTNVKAELAITILIGPPSTQQSAGWMWGAETANSGVTILHMVARTGQEFVFVPLSAYSDLANPYDIALVRQGKGHVLTIKGGDAANAYRARLRFQSGILLDRRVESGEFPREVHEETKYHFNMLRN